MNSHTILNTILNYTKTINQRTNDPVYNHMINGPSINTKYTKPGYKWSIDFSTNFYLYYLNDVGLCQGQGNLDYSCTFIHSRLLYQPISRPELQ